MSVFDYQNLFDGGILSVDHGKENLNYGKGELSGLIGSAGAEGIKKWSLLDAERVEESWVAGIGAIKEVGKVGGLIYLFMDDEGWGDVKNLTDGIFEEFYRRRARIDEPVRFKFVKANWVGGLLSNPYVLYDNPKLNQEKSVRGEKMLKKKIVPHLKLKGERPDLVLMFDPVKRERVIRDCWVSGVPVLSFMSVDGSVKKVDFPVFGNPDSLRGRVLFCWRMRLGYLDGVKEKVAVREWNKTVHFD